MEVTANLAESTLNNLNNAMGGALRAGNIITFGDGALKTMNIKIQGLTPGATQYLAEIFIPKCSAIGSDAASYRKGEKTMWPVTFSAIKATGSKAASIVYNAA